MMKEFRDFTSLISLAIVLFCVVSLASIPLSNAKEFGANEDDPEPGEQIAKLRELLQVEELKVPKLTGELQLDGTLAEPLWDQAASYEIKIETFEMGKIRRNEMLKEAA